MDNLCLSWHGNLVSCSNWAGATAAVYVSGLKSVKSWLCLSFHLSGFRPKTNKKWKVTHNSYWTIRHTRYFWHEDTHSPLHLVSYRKKDSPHEHAFLIFLLFRCSHDIGKQTKPHSVSPNSAALQHLFCFQQPIYPNSSFNRYDVSLPLSNPQEISRAITSCLHLEPRIRRKIYSWANIWKLHQLCLNIYVHVYIVKNCIS